MSGDEHGAKTDDWRWTDDLDVVDKGDEKYRPRMARMLRGRQIACQELDRRWGYLLSVTEKILRDNGIHW